MIRTTEGESSVQSRLLVLRGLSGVRPLQVGPLVVGTDPVRDVQIASVAVAGEGDEAGFVEEGVVAEDVGAGDGEALAGVDGEGVAVVEPAWANVVAGERDGGVAPGDAERVTVRCLRIRG